MFMSLFSFYLNKIYTFSKFHARLACKQKYYRCMMQNHALRMEQFGMASCFTMTKVLL